MKLLNILFIVLLLSYFIIESFQYSINAIKKEKKSVNESDDDDDDDDENNAKEVTDDNDKNDDKTDDDKNDNDDDDSSESQNGMKLLIILVDGFRYDYVERDKTLKGFPRIVKNGVRAEYVTPVFPSNSYPNWYSIVTGLYAESHGFVQNYMYDEENNDYFLMTPHPNASHTHWWNDAEPLWVTAEKKGIKSALYLWDGCQVKIRGKVPTVCQEYKALYEWPLVSNETRIIIDKVIQDFIDDKYRLAQVYYEYVDHTGHAYGPRSSKTKQAIRDIDDIIYDIQDSLIKRELSDEVNVVIVSDHGMIDAKEFQDIHMEHIIDFNDVELFLGGGSIAMILPEDDKEDHVYEQIRQAQVKGLNVYKKDNIPKRYHLKSNSLVLPILITTDDGYLLRAPPISGKVYPLVEEDERMRGHHGYDPSHVHEMRGIMYGFGPAFRTQYIGKPLKQIDHYNLFCHLLDIKPRPNNGSWDRIERYLKGAENDDNDDVTEESDENDDDDDNGNNKDDNDLAINAYNSFSQLILIILIISVTIFS